MDNLKEKYDSYVLKKEAKLKNKYRCFKFAYSNNEELLMEQIDLYQGLLSGKEISTFITKKKFEENVYELIGDVYVRTYEEIEAERIWDMAEIVKKVS